MANERLVQIQPLEGTLARKPAPAPAAMVSAGPGKTCGIDVGSTTCKFVLVSQDGQLLGAILRTPQYQAGRKSSGVSDSPRNGIQTHASSRPRFLHRLGLWTHRSSCRREDDSGSCRGRRIRRKSSSFGALRQRNWRRRYEDHFLQRNGDQQEQTSPDAGRLFRRHRHFH